MIESISVYANEVSGILMAPFLILFLSRFSKESMIPEKYGIATMDLQNYLLFSIVIIPFQFIVDMIIMNVLELLHTWPVSFFSIKNEILFFVLFYAKFLKSEVSFKSK